MNWIVLRKFGIVYHFTTLRQAGLLQFCFMEDTDLLILRNQYHICLWPGDTEAIPTVVIVLSCFNRKHTDSTADMAYMSLGQDYISTARFCVVPANWILLCCFFCFNPKSRFEKISRRIGEYIRKSVWYEWKNHYDALCCYWRKF